MFFSDSVFTEFILVQFAGIFPVVVLMIYSVTKFPITVERRWDGAVVVKETSRYRTGWVEEEYVFEKNSKGEYRLTNHLFEVIAGIVAIVFFMAMIGVAVCFVVCTGNGTKELNIINGFIILGIIEIAVVATWDANSKWIRPLLAFKRWNNSRRANKIKDVD